MKTDYLFHIKMLLALFTVDRGKIKVLLFKKTKDPYKGYWVFPSKCLEREETFAQNTKSILKKYIGNDTIYTERFKTFEDTENLEGENFIYSTSYGIMDIATALYQTEMIEGKESNWFFLDSIPKMAYNQEEILREMMCHLKIRLRSSEMIKRLFPSDFTLPELQTFCEQLLDDTLDRRNFRKKVLALDVLEDTNETSEPGTGRPAKLYKFKDEIEKVTLF